MQLEFWGLSVIILAMIYYKSQAEGFSVKSSWSKFFWLNFLYELGVIWLFLAIFQELNTRPMGPHKQFWMLLLVLLSGGHFLPRIFFHLRVKEGLSDNAKQDNLELELREGLSDFVEGTIREVMIPINDILKVDIDASFEELLKVKKYKPYSRIPVYDQEKDNVTGIFYAKELIKSNLDKTWEELLQHKIRTHSKKAYFVPELMEQAILLKDMQEKKIQMSIVVDEYGVVTGLVTMEDLVETIIGELHDRRNDNEVMVHSNDYREWVVDARMELDDISELVQKEIDSDLVETIGGFLFNNLGHLPQVGEYIEYESLRIEVVEMSDFRIRKLLLRELH
ncbi:MAG: HlyC/CorC family transporter [Candidatus Cloacimonetes bacterium]|nr:HlyC/CorC family transporter [Candidatus Cloacimonadota bacterium]